MGSDNGFLYTMRNEWEPHARCRLYLHVCCYFHAACGHFDGDLLDGEIMEPVLKVSSQVFDGHTLARSRGMSYPGSQMIMRHGSFQSSVYGRDLTIYEGDSTRRCQHLPQTRIHAAVQVIHYACVRL